MKTQIKCPAKINLSLDVINRRQDGYHNLSMIMQEIGIYDILTMETGDFEGITLTADKEGVPTDDSNLIVKAAKLFFEKTAIKSGLKVHLRKNIPMGAGLGGGSTDGAGTLVALNEMFGEPIDIDTLAVMAKKLGADVPFFLFGGCMLAEGIGEKLTPVSPLTNVHIVVAKPQVHVSTAYVYKNLVLNGETVHPDTQSVIAALETGDVDLLAKSAGNVLETVTAKEYPQIEEYKSIMKAEGAVYSLMSGSGSAVFGVFREKVTAQSAFERFKGMTDEVYMV